MKKKIAISPRASRTKDTSSNVENKRRLALTGSFKRSRAAFHSPFHKPKTFTGGSFIESRSGFDIF